MTEFAAGEIEGILERVEHLGSAGMKNEMVDGLEGEAVRSKEAFHRRAQILADQVRDVAAEQNAEPVLFDAPAHHVERVRPGMFAPGTHGETVAIAGEHRRRGAIAEQGGGADIALRAIHAAEIGRESGRERGCTYG